jgi:hypothetical protein
VRLKILLSQNRLSRLKKTCGAAPEPLPGFDPSHLGRKRLKAGNNYAAPHNPDGFPGLLDNPDDLQAPVFEICH